MPTITLGINNGIKNRTPQPDQTKMVSPTKTGTDAADVGPLEMLWRHVRCQQGGRWTTAIASGATRCQNPDNTQPDGKLQMPHSIPNMPDWQPTLKVTIGNAP